MKAVLWSYDFLIGMSVGIASGFLPVYLGEVRGDGFAYLTAVSAMSAGIVALVLSPMAILLGALGPAMLAALRTLPGQLRGVLEPFLVVLAVAASASISALLGSMFAPLEQTAPRGAIWAFTAVPTGLFVWSLLGCVQLTRYMADLIEKNHAYEALVDRKRAAERESNP